MNQQIYLEIGDLESLMSFMAEAKRRTGLMKDVSLEKMRQTLSGKDFPMRIPVNLDGVLDLAGNPILKKMFCKNIDQYLTAAIGAG